MSWFGSPGGAEHPAHSPQHLLVGSTKNVATSPLLGGKPRSKSPWEVEGPENTGGGKANKQTWGSVAKIKSMSLISLCLSQLEELCARRNYFEAPQTPFFSLWVSPKAKLIHFFCSIRSPLRCSPPMYFFLSYFRNIPARAIVSSTESGERKLRCYWGLRDISCFRADQKDFFFFFFLQGACYGEVRQTR